MTWLALGVGYSLVYLAIGASLQGHPAVLLWFRAIALLGPPLAGVAVIVRRRHAWSGCEWLFWATIALGLMMSAISLLGWTADELLIGRETSWLGWHAVFALFGAVAPLFALLAQPHRGPRESVAATTAVDIAGVAVLTGFLYSFFVITPESAPGASSPSLSLLILSEAQQFLVFIGMAVAAIVARAQPWGVVYRRLAIGLLVNFATLVLTNLEIWRGGYRSGFVYDVTWILPFAFYPWATSAAPSSVEAAEPAGQEPTTPSRPWIIFAALALIPLLDYALRRASPLGELDGFRDLSTAVTIVSVLPLLMARLAVERAELRQTGARLHRADAQARLLADAIEQADDLISISTPGGRLQHANAAFSRALGYERKELATIAPGELVAPESEALVGDIHDSVRGGAIWRGTLVRRRKDRSTFPSRGTVAPLTDGSGQITHFVAVERDITEDARLRDQLIHSERLSAVGQLVSGVAHELNNPLQSILGFAELLLDAEQRQPMRHDLERVRSETMRASKIVRNLLAFVRRSSSERKLTNLNDLVRSAVALRAYELTLANVELIEQYAPELPPVAANPEEIQQVVLNLVLNAEHAMRGADGLRRLSVTTSLVDDSVAVEVADDGPGVPESTAGQIFEPFFSTKEVGEGTGLGLSIGLGIAEAHGGSLALVPTPAGACFRLTLPAAAAQVTTAPVSTEPEALAGSEGAGRRALIVDDEPTLRELLRRLLMRRNFAVDVAADGEAAAALLEHYPYDVIFCDVRMPRMGGLVLYHRVEARHPARLRGFAFLSGDVVNPELKSFVERTRVPMLSKPFAAADLDDLLGRLQAN